MKIKIFGQLRDVFPEENMTIENAGNVEELKNRLFDLYPGLTKKSFVVAVNRKITHENILLEADSEIALLPPFSGG